MDIKKVIKRFLSFSIGTWVNAIISLISIPIISRLILPTEYGKASMFTLAVSLLQCIFVLGVDQSFARFYNETPINKRVLLFKDTISPVILFSTIGILPIQLFKKEISNLLFNNQNYLLEINLLCVAVIISSLLRIGLLSIRMQNKAKTYSLLQVINAVVTLACTIAYAYFIERSSLSIIIGFAISQIATLFLCILLDRGNWLATIKNIILPHKSGIKALLTYGLPFVPTFIVDWFFQGIARSFLRIYSNYTELGLYASAVKISLSLTILQTGFTTFWVPFALEKYNTAPGQTTFYSRFFNILTYAFGVLICTILLFDNILIRLFPIEYYPIKFIFPFLLFVPMLYTLSEVTVVGINYYRKTISHLYIAIGASLTNAILGLALIPLYGAIGASISTFFAYISFFILRTAISNKYYKVSYDFKKLFMSLLILVIFVLLKVTFDNPYLNLFSFACILLLTSIYWSDIQKLKKQLLHR